jgi:protoheme IX farnesyltransferase
VNSKSEKRWLPFFLWTNLSMLIFLSVPVFDKWLYLSLN